MALLWFLTHPQVVVDPEVPVPHWGLSDVGRARAQAFSGAPLLDAVTAVWCSTEAKARETAALVVGNTGIPLFEHAGLGENDRSATGFLPPHEFESVADEFFARPEVSVRGWERAVDAQHRIVRAVTEVLADARFSDGDVLIIAHGAVGTLLLCHLLARPITRQLDQPGPGGCVFAADRVTLHPHGTWRPLESLL